MSTSPSGIPKPEPQSHDSALAVANGSGSVPASMLLRIAEIWAKTSDAASATCRHEFRIADLTDTDIAQPATPPEGSGYYAWLDYYCGLSAHPANSERVKWACCKCGKEYRAHCGLDILNHGKIASPNGHDEP